VRIVAGSCKGTRLAAPKGVGTRPTSDKVREAIFSIIGPVDGLTVLDLFAGSGALGLEALSRGATRAVLVDADHDAIRAIERNVEKLALDRAVVVRSDATRFLARERGRYDLVFLDPPYELVESLRMPLAERLPRVLGTDATVCYETAASVEPDLPLELESSRCYGSTRVTIFRR
jgi:16S rRNA (guanine966-N2)-methyltransferase